MDSEEAKDGFRHRERQKLAQALKGESYEPKFTSMIIIKAADLYKGLYAFSTYGFDPLKRIEMCAEEGAWGMSLLQTSTHTVST